MRKSSERERERKVGSTTSEMGHLAPGRPIKMRALGNCAVLESREEMRSIRRRREAGEEEGKEEGPRLARVLQVYWYVVYYYTYDVVVRPSVRVDFSLSFFLFLERRLWRAGSAAHIPAFPDSREALDARYYVRRPDRISWSTASRCWPSLKTDGPVGDLQVFFTSFGHGRR